MSERGLYAKVGLLVISALAALAVLFFVLGNYSWRDTFPVTVDFGFVGNLTPGAPVKVAGIQVGRVEKISFLGGRIDETTRRRVYARVHLQVEKRARAVVRTDSRIYINTQGMLGEQYVEIEPGNPDNADSREWEPGMPPIVGHSPPRMDLLLSRTYTILDETTKLLGDERPTLIKGLRETAALLENVNTLLSSNREGIRHLVEGSGELLSETAKSVQTANAVLGDGKELKNALQSTQQLLNLANARLPRLLDQTEKTLAETQALTRLVGPKERDRIFASLDRMERLTDLLEQIAREGHGLLKKINAGEGTAGALVTKRDVYEDLRELVRDLRENPWKLFWKD